jgi:hypothetical protein
MIFLGVELLFLVTTIRLVKYALDVNADFRRVRREGVELQAEVVDYEKRSGSRSGEFYLKPVVKYYLNDRTYQATLTNPPVGNPLDLGSFTTVVVSPKTPYEPYNPYASPTSTILFALGSAVAALAMLWLAITRL